MNESMRKYMKVGIILHMAFRGLASGEGPILECLKKIVTDEYFEAVEVTWIRDQEVRKQAADMIRCGHMEVAYGGQPRMLTTGGNINHLDEEKRLAALASLKEGIDEAYEMGAAGFSFLAGNYEKATRRQSLEALLKSSGELCRYAKAKGDMPVTLEVFDYDIDKRSLMGPVKLVKEYAEIMNSEFDNFGLLVDCSHIPMLHETFEENLMPVAPYIKHAHMGNTVIRKPSLPAYGDQHPRFGFPDSENDVKELAHYLKVLLEIGFLSKQSRPIVSFEVKPWKEEDSEVVIANAKRTLNLAWDMI